MKSSIFPEAPVSSSVILSIPTSMTCASNTSATWKISPRARRFALTFTSASSRCRAAAAGEVEHLDHVHEPVQLLLDLLDHRVVAAGTRG